MLSSLKIISNYKIRKIDHIDYFTCMHYSTDRMFRIISLCFLIVAIILRLIIAIVFFSFSSLLATTNDKGILLFDTKQRSKKEPLLTSIWSSTTVHSVSAQCVRWFPNDNGMFMTAGRDKQFCVWDVNQLKVADTIHLKNDLYLFDVSHNGWIAGKL